ncbi:Cysteamine dioxygenase [Bertholletia excelsa]
MGIKNVLASREVEDCQLKSEMKSKSKKSRRRQRRVSQVQKLYLECKEVFTGGPGIIPPSDDIERIKSVLDGMTAMEVGVSPDMPYFRRTLTDEVQKITYLHIHECDKFSIGIFCLPPSGVIPLHNHPGMTVFSKLLFGTMHIKSYDWALDVTPNEHPSGVRLAKVKVDSEFTAPCNTSILYPADGGNMHCFTALTPCAVLDVLGPPYSEPDGRHCTYYLEYPFSSFSVEGLSLPEEETKQHAWLQEREKPDDLTVVGLMYFGPQIVDK